MLRGRNRVYEMRSLLVRWNELSVVHREDLSTHVCGYRSFFLANRVQYPDGFFTGRVAMLVPERAQLKASDKATLMVGLQRRGEMPGSVSGIAVVPEYPM